MHEAKLHERNVFTTFTYADDKLPLHGSLHYPHFQGFMHRLRAHVNYKCPKEQRTRVRFFCAGEYGSKSARPHYHALIFNYQPADLRLYGEDGPNALYTSSVMDSLWTHGETKSGALTFESAAYCARYCIDKVTGDQSEAHYRVVTDFSTGEMHSLVPEFAIMSRRPGIGAGWFSKYHSDVYPHGKCVVNGREVNPPKFYDRMFERVDELAMQRLRDQRIADGESRSSDNTRARLLVKDQIAKARVKRFDRDY
jgi:hypothetical protein